LPVAACGDFQIKKSDIMTVPATRVSFRVIPDAILLAGAEISPQNCFVSETDRADFKKTVYSPICPKEKNEKYKG